MSKNKRISKEIIELRREKIRSLMARGVRKPARILMNEDIKKEYIGYKNPYSSLQKDMKAIAKENEKMIKSGLKDGALGIYISGLYELLIQCYKDYNKLKGNAKVGMAKTIREVLQDIARAYGIDPDKIDPRAFILNIDSHVENQKADIQLPDEFYDEFAVSFARRIGKQNKQSFKELSDKEVSQE